MAAVLLVTVAKAWSQPTLLRAPADQDQVDVQVVAAQQRVQPGAQLPVAVVFNLKPGWHINTHQPQVPSQLGSASSNIATTIKVAPGSNSSLAIHPTLIHWPKPHAVTVNFTGKAASYRVFSGKAVAYLPVNVDSSAAPGSKTLKLRITYQACNNRQCLMPVRDQPIELHVTVVKNAAASVTASQHPGLFKDFPVDLWRKVQGGAASRINFNLFGAAFTLDGRSTPGFITLLAIAALGGLLLNLTPCVLPVIPLKIMCLSQAAGRPARCLSLGLAMALGLVTFWLGLGAAMASLTGFTAVNQLFQSPLFTIGLGVFITMMAIGMCGLFAVRLPRIAYLTNPRHDTYVGSFAAGVMAAVLSTPCTAPFMGAALGWATRQGPTVSLATFAAIGAGMALPYLLLASYPRLVSRVPRTGPANVLVKQVMGLLMLAAGAYFMGVGITTITTSGSQSTSQIYWWPVMLLIAAAGAWLAWRTCRITGPIGMRITFAGLGVLLVVASLDGGVRLTARGPINWVPYTPARFAQALKRHHVVLMDFTAEWCLNCKVLEQSVLHDPAIVRTLDGANVVPMKVDLTSPQPAARVMLGKQGRRTIPLLVVFRPDGEAVFKSDFYTAPQVRRAIAKAGKTNRSSPDDPNGS